MLAVPTSGLLKLWAYVMTVVLPCALITVAKRKSQGRHYFARNVRTNALLNLCLNRSDNLHISGIRGDQH